MDTRAFLARAGDLFVGEGEQVRPIDPYWAALTERVDGYTSAQQLAILGLAAELLPTGEAYLEVGTFKGRSLCAAVRHSGNRTFHAVENFLEFGMTGESARAELDGNLATHAAESDVRLQDGDCFEVMAREQAFDQPIGVYFYDGEHTLLAHYLALAAVEPHLADEALVLVDDATWPVVQKAHRWFLRRHYGWSIEARWDASEPDDPQWANGLHALVFRRTGPSRLDRALLSYQIRGQAKVNALAWAVADRAPKLTKTAAGLLLSWSRTIGGKQP